MTLSPEQISDLKRRLKRAAEGCGHMIVNPGQAAYLSELIVEVEAELPYDPPFSIPHN